MRGVASNPTSKHFERNGDTPSWWAARRLQVAHTDSILLHDIAVQAFTMFHGNSPGSHCESVQCSTFNPTILVSSSPYQVAGRTSRALKYAIGNIVSYCFVMFNLCSIYTSPVARDQICRMLPNDFCISALTANASNLNSGET